MNVAQKKPVNSAKPPQIRSFFPHFFNASANAQSHIITSHINTLHSTHIPITQHHTQHTQQSCVHLRSMLSLLSLPGNPGCLAPRSRRQAAQRSPVRALNVHARRLVVRAAAGALSSWRGEGLETPIAGMCCRQLRLQLCMCIARGSMLAD